HDRFHRPKRASTVPAAAPAAPAPSRPAKSAESSRLQVIIGLDDFPQLVLRAAIAAIGVGMVTLHQFLEARLDVEAGGALLEAQRMERLALGIAKRAPLGLGLGVLAAHAAAEVAKNAEGIIGLAARIGPPGPALHPSG